MSNKEVKKDATKKEEKNVKQQAAEAKVQRAAEPKAEVKEAPKKEAPKVEEPKTISVPVYRLGSEIKAESYKGQRKMMVEAFAKAGKALAAEQVEPYLSDPKAFTQQAVFPVVKYHCIKMLEDGLLVEEGSIEIPAPKRVRKTKEAAPTATATAETQATA